MKKYIVICILSLLIIPNLVFAAWWNPFTWSIFNRPAKIQIQQVQIATTTTGVSNIATTTKATPETPKIIKKVQQTINKSTSNFNLTQPATQQVVNTTPSSPPNKILCNGTYWDACPAGQELICPNDGINPYCQVPPPAATSAQIAGIALLCSFAQAQGNTEVIKDCTDGTILNGYNTNTRFRSNVDNSIQVIRQKIAQQQTATNNQIYVQNYMSSLNTDNQIYQNNMQLQNSINAQNATLQQQEQNNKYTPPPTPTQMKCTTQPRWDAGVLRYSTNCGQTNY